MKRIALFALLVPVLVWAWACAGNPTADTSTKRALAAPAPGPASFLYAAGTAGAYTVPSGAFVTGITAHATGSGAYLTIAVQAVGQATDAGTGPQVPIPAGVGIELGRPVLLGSVQELGPGTVITTSGTDSYLVTLVQAR